MSKKINLVLLYCGVRTGHFGVGRHFNTLLPSFMHHDDVDLRIIRTDELSVQYVYDDVDNDVPILYIPQPENGLFIASENSIFQKTYARLIVEISIPFILSSDASNTIFLVNSADYVNVCMELKATIDCAIIYVHHSWGWKTVFNVSDADFSSYYQSQDGNLQDNRSMLYDLVRAQKEMAECSDVVITVTQQALRFFQNTLEILGNKMICIYNGIAFNHKINLDRTKLRRQMGFSDTDKIVLFSGRIREDKGLMFLINAIKLLAFQDSTIRLVLAGSGDYEKFLSETSSFSTRVTFTGEISQEILAKWYTIADVGVIPSLHEQCSFTALEMRFYKLPTIVSSVDGLDEMYEHKFDSLKLDIHVDMHGKKLLDQQQLATYIKLLCTDRELATRLAENAYDRGKILYTADEMQRQYLQVIQRVGAHQAESI